MPGFPSNFLFRHAVTVQTATYANSRGQRVPSFTSTARQALVQPMTLDRAQLYGLEVGEIGYSVFFAVDPGVQVNDRILDASGRTLIVLGPALDQGGQGHVWLVDCKAINQS